MLTKNPCRYHSSLREILCLAIMVMMAGCDGIDPPTRSTATAGEATTRASVTADSRATEDGPHVELARAIASAMAEDELRRKILHAMRDSRLTEHKLVFEDFLESGVGGRLAEAAARALGESGSHVDALVAELPSMDFYVPDRGQRRTWRGGPEIMVTAIDNLDSEHALAFRPDGSSKVISTPQDAGVDALFVLHPEEPKNLRSKPADSDGETIQGSDERDVLSGASAFSNPQAQSVEAEPCGPDAVIECDQGSGTGQIPGTFVDQIVIFFEDCGVCGAAEVFWRTTPFSNDDEMKSEVVSGLPTEQLVSIDPPVKIHDVRADTFNQLFSKLFEDDSILFGGGDDSQGEATIDGEGLFPSIDAIHFPEQPLRAEYNVIVDYP